MSQVGRRQWKATGGSRLKTAPTRRVAALRPLPHSGQQPLLAEGGEDRVTIWHGRQLTRLSEMSLSAMSDILTEDRGQDSGDSSDRIGGRDSIGQVRICVHSRSSAVKTVPVGLCVLGASAVKIRIAVGNRSHGRSRGREAAPTIRAARWASTPYLSLPRQRWASQQRLFVSIV